MRIPVPSSVHPLVRLTAQLPDGQLITHECVNTEKHWDLELPEGVCEDAVSVLGDFLTASNKVADSIVVKHCVECDHECSDETPEITDAPEDRLPEAGDDIDAEIETQSEDEA